MPDMDELDRNVAARRIVDQIQRDVAWRREMARERRAHVRRQRRTILFLGLTFLAFAVLIASATWLPW